MEKNMKRMCVYMYIQKSLYCTAEMKHNNVNQLYFYKILKNIFKKALVSVVAQATQLVNGRISIHRTDTLILRLHSVFFP